MVAGSSGSPASQIRTASTSCSGSAFWLCRVSPRARSARRQLRDRSSEAGWEPGREQLERFAERRRIRQRAQGDPSGVWAAVLLRVLRLGNARQGGFPRSGRSGAPWRGVWLLLLVLVGGWRGPSGERRVESLDLELGHAAIRSSSSASERKASEPMWSGRQMTSGWCRIADFSKSSRAGICVTAIGSCSAPSSSSIAL